MPKMSLSGENSENFEIFFYTFQQIETFKNFPKKKTCNSFQCLGPSPRTEVLKNDLPLSAQWTLNSLTDYFSFYFLLL